MSELKQLIRDAIWRHTGSPLVEDYAESVIKAIEASGRVTVDRARFERLLRVAESAYEYTNAPYPSGERDSAESHQTKAVDALQPGDLDPLP